MDINYQKKYLKYKNKYLNILNKLHGGDPKYKILDDFYNYKPNIATIDSDYTYPFFNYIDGKQILRWGKTYSVYHSFPEHIEDIIEFVGEEANILEVGSGAGIIAARLAHDGKINMTCTDIKPPQNIYHECYIIENPFINQKSVNKKCINGNIIQEDYTVPNFDTLLLVWPPFDGHFTKGHEWNHHYRPENILKQALEINKNLKVIVIGEPTGGSTGTTKFWNLIDHKFEKEIEIYNNYNQEDIHEYTMLFKTKQNLNYKQLKKEKHELKIKYGELLYNYRDLKIKYENLKKKIEPETE